MCVALMPERIVVVHDTVCTYLLLVARATTNGRDGATRITLNWVTDKRRRVGPAGIQGVPSRKVVA